MSRKELEDVVRRKPTLLPRSVKQELLMKIDELKSIRKDYEPKKDCSCINDGLIEYKSEVS